MKRNEPATESLHQPLAYKVTVEGKAGVSRVTLLTATIDTNWHSTGAVRQTLTVSTRSYALRHKDVFRSRGIAPRILTIPRNQQLSETKVWTRSTWREEIGVSAVLHLQMAGSMRQDGRFASFFKFNC
jgi:hypothetical protein